ncbi:MAG: Holliday junction branch migration protein RuvA [Oscillospiraceae bacterium]|nr:Holliday junction branch migration protein RuvA [Oscillospiraceae bacterium]
MIYSLNGILSYKDDSVAVIECAGVGYAAKASWHTLSTLGKIGETARLYTYMHIYEGGAELFGFADLLEKSCFIQLISVSGVGPKAAISILSSIPAQQVALLIASGDDKAFTRIKGIGTKTAQRIVLELKDRITKEKTPATVLQTKACSSDGANVSDALSALMVLGYTQNEVMPIISKLDCSLPSQDIIKQVLKALSVK